jgi:hypothetical protein
LVHNKEVLVGSKARASIPENAGRRETIMKKTYKHYSRDRFRLGRRLTAKIRFLQCDISNNQKPTNGKSLLWNCSFCQSLKGSESKGDVYQIAECRDSPVWQGICDNNHKEKVGLRIFKSDEDLVI